MGLIAVETFHLSHHLQNILVLRNILSGNSMPRDDAKSISIKLVSHLDTILNLCLKYLRGNICDIEVFDGVLLHYLSGLNSLDILVQPPFESDSF